MIRLITTNNVAGEVIDDGIVWMEEGNFIPAGYEADNGE